MMRLSQKAAAAAFGEIFQTLSARKMSPEGIKTTLLLGRNGEHADEVIRQYPQVERHVRNILDPTVSHNTRVRRYRSRKRLVQLVEGQKGTCGYCRVAIRTGGPHNKRFCCASCQVLNGRFWRLERERTQAEGRPFAPDDPQVLARREAAVAHLRGRRRRRHQRQIRERQAALGLPDW